MEEILTTVKSWATAYSIQIIGAIVILLVGILTAKLLRRLMRRLINKSNLEPTIANFLSNLFYGLLVTFVVIITLGQLGVETTSFIAILGAAGLAVGFALKDSLSNFAAGVMVLIFRQFNVGDSIEGGGTKGTVEEVNIFSTRLVTPDNKVVFVPNSKLVSDNITNFTAKDTRRVDMVFGIGYSDDIDKARGVILKVISSDDRILRDPEPQILVGELADSSVNFNVRPWVKKEDYWGVYSDVTENIKKRFDEEGISIPFPQRDIHTFQN